jgi:HD-like signal output (HDOD) protein
MIKNDKKRIILCGPTAVRERLGEGKEFTFVPYGKAEPTMLATISQTEVNGVVVHFGPENTNAVAFVDQAGEIRPELPCFILCHQRDQVKLAERGWQVITMTEKTGVVEIEDKLARSLFLFPLVKRDSLRRILGVLKKIPTEAANHQKIMRRLQDPQFQMDDVVRMIKQDLALTAQLLKITNSAAFAREKPVQDVNEAVAMLGSARLQALISSAWAFFLMNDNVCQGFFPQKEWEHANIIADLVAKKCTVQQLDAPAAETAFISAMLHDIGKLLLAANLPFDYSAVLKAGETKEDGVWEAENEMFGFNHAEVGGCLLALWGLPLPVAAAVLNHHSRGQPEGTATSLIQWAHDQVKPRNNARGGEEIKWLD